MAQKKKMTVTKIETPVRDAGHAEHVAAAHDAVLNLVDMNMTDDFDSRFANQVSGEENPSSTLVNALHLWLTCQSIRRCATQEA